jgi:DHA3 family macrolide efflux protein-like MFS transporter
MMRNRNRGWKAQFAILWAGQAVSMLTSSVLQMSIVWYITLKTGSAAVLSAATLIAFVPQAILGTFTGAYIDRYNRKKVLIAADLFIAFISLILVISGYISEISIAFLLLLAGIRSIGAAFHYPTLQAITPLIVPKEHLTKYAGYAKGFESLSSIASPGIAIALYALLPLNRVALFDVFGALFAVFLLTFVKLPQREPRNSTEKPHLLQEVRQGFSVIRHEPGMVPLMVIGALYAIIYFPIGSYYPLITMTYFGGTVAASGLVETVFALGVLGGSLLLGIFGGKLSKRRMLISSVFFYGACVLITGLLPSSGLIVFICLSAVMGLTIPFYSGVETAIFQTRIKEEYLGRVFSLSSSISMVAMPVGLILSGIFAQWLGVEKWFSILGALALLLAILSLRIPSLHSWDKTDEDFHNPS